ncbi:MAG: TetR/AcrR family transcriptional regulator [Acidimicrobiales bacterium]
MRSTVLQDGEPAAGILSTNQAARRQRIVDTALGLLEVREYERIQVKDVADGASVALGTVYHYFSSKEQLFGEALVQWAGTLGTSISRRSLAGADPASRLEDALHRSVRAFERRPQLAKLVARLEVSEDPFAADVLSRLDATTNLVYLAALDGFEPEKALRVVRVADAVLDSSLRAWSAGRLPIKEVYRSLSDVVALVLPTVEPDPVQRTGSDTTPKRSW